MLRRTGKCIFCTINAGFAEESSKSQCTTKSESQLHAPNCFACELIDGCDGPGCSQALQDGQSLQLQAHPSALSHYLTSASEPTPLPIKGQLHTMADASLTHDNAPARDTDATIASNGTGSSRPSQLLFIRIDEGLGPAFASAERPRFAQNGLPLRQALRRDASPPKIHDVTLNFTKACEGEWSARPFGEIPAFGIASRRPSCMCYHTSDYIDTYTIMVYRLLSTDHVSQPLMLVSLSRMSTLLSSNPSRPLR